MGLVSKQPEEDEEDGPEIRITGFGELDTGNRDEIEIDLSSWSEAARQALDERLHLLQAPHRWNGTWLVAAASDQMWIENIVDQVQTERTVQLDDEADQIAYDLAGWDVANRALLESALEEQEIPYGIDGDELIVQEIDEVRVDEIVDAILEPDAPPAERAEARTEVMGELFVAADRLAHDPEDPQGRVAIVEGAEEATTHAPPYGMDKSWWARVGQQCEDLADLIATEGVEEARITEDAAALRDVLRPYV